MIEVRMQSDRNSNLANIVSFLLSGHGYILLEEPPASSMESLLSSGVPSGILGAQRTKCNGRKLEGLLGRR